MDKQNVIASEKKPLGNTAKRPYATPVVEPLSYSANDALYESKDGLIYYDFGYGVEFDWNYVPVQ